MENPLVVDVLCVGNASYDMVFRVDHHPGEDEKMVADNFTCCGGGPAGNAAVAVARLGFKAAFAGYLGSDVFGDLYLQELVMEGVDTSLVVRGSDPTPVSSVLVKPDGMRSLVNYRGSTPHLPEDRLDFSRIEPNVILFDGHEPNISPPLVRSAKEKGIPTILDAGSVHAGTQALAPIVDYLVCSEKFAREYTGETDETNALAVLRTKVPTVVITLGSHGLIWATNDETGRLPAYAVDVVDSTGAGDVFHGAFAACVAQGKGWRETLEYAGAAAALCCTKAGARPGIPTRAEVERFLFSR